jgi:hypothetical protein
MARVSGPPVQNGAAPGIGEIVCGESDDGGADEDGRLRQGFGIGGGRRGEREEGLLGVITLGEDQDG